MKVVDNLKIAAESTGPAVIRNRSIRNFGRVRYALLYRVAAVLLPILVVTGCEIIIDADFPDYTPELAVYSFVSPGEKIVVAVFQTQDVRVSGSSQWNTVLGASVTIWQDGALRLTADLQEVTDEFGAPPYYVADWSDVIRLDSPITLKVEAAGLPDVQSTVAIPDPALFTFQNATAVDDPDDFSGGNFKSVTARFRLVDQAGADNYFLLIRTTDVGPFESYFDPGFSVSDAPFRQTVLGETEEYETRLFFSDATFRDGAVKFSIKYRTDGGGSGAFKLYSVSKSYYEYERTRVIQQETVDNPFAEPSPIYSNIEGGQGVLGTTSTGTAAQVSF